MGEEKDATKIIADGIKNKREEEKKGKGEELVTDKEAKVKHEEDADSGDSSAESEDEELVKLFAQKISITSETVTNEPKKEKATEFATFKEGTLKELASVIKSCNKIIVMCGAGISTAAGIPDFRSPGTGLYSNLQKYKLPYPEAIFELEYFYKNPRPFYTLAKELFPGQFNPTLSHKFIKLLQEKNKLLRCYTQNIDTLERDCGINDDLLVEAHGSFHTAHCIECKQEYSFEEVKDAILSDKVPECLECNNYVKPDIVFFGENLPERFYKLSSKDFKECDLLIVMGTSLVVQPFCLLVGRVLENCPRVLINGERSGTAVYGGFDFSNKKRDLFFKGICDEIVEELVTELNGQKKQFV